jgi:hypothetical protein
LRDGEKPDTQWRRKNRSEGMARCNDLLRARRFGLERQGFMKLKKSSMSAWITVCACGFIMGLSFVFGVSSGEVLKATPDHFDFGSIPEGEPAIAVASIENVSNTPVEITNVRTS